mgnify:FL=1
MGYEGIIWDCGGVIINFDADITNRLLSQATGKDPQEINAYLYGGSATGREYNEGAIEPYYLGGCDSSQFYRIIKKGLNLQMAEKEFAAIWKATFTNPNTEIVEFIHALHPRYQQVILSSTNPWQWDRMNEFSTIGGRIDLETLLGKERIVTSYSVGHKKPAPQLFEAACRSLGLRKEECVYIDDIKKYTDAFLAWGGGNAVHVDLNADDFVENCIDDLIKLGFFRRVS